MHSRAAAQRPREAQRQLRAVGTTSAGYTSRTRGVGQHAERMADVLVCAWHAGRVLRVGVPGLEWREEVPAAAHTGHAERSTAHTGRTQGWTSPAEALVAAVAHHTQVAALRGTPVAAPLAVVGHLGAGPRHTARAVGVGQGAAADRHVSVNFHNKPRLVALGNSVSARS